MALVFSKEPHVLNQMELRGVGLGEDRSQEDSPLNLLFLSPHRGGVRPFPVLFIFSGLISDNSSWVKRAFWLISHRYETRRALRVTGDVPICAKPPCAPKWQLG